MLRSLRLTLLLAVVAAALGGYSYLDAQWVGPIDNPPYYNAPAPLHEGSETQYKTGALGIASLGVYSNATVSGTTTGDHVFARLYCDGNGDNCTRLSDLTCAPGQLMVYTSGAWQCRDDRVGDTLPNCPAGDTLVSNGSGGWNCS